MRHFILNISKQLFFKSLFPSQAIHWLLTHCVDLKLQIWSPKTASNTFLPSQQIPLFSHVQPSLSHPVKCEGWTPFLARECCKWRSKRALWTWHLYDLSQMLLHIVGVFPLILVHSASGCYFGGCTFALLINVMVTGCISAAPANTPPCKHCSLAQGFRPLICLIFTWLLCTCLFTFLSNHCSNRSYTNQQQRIQLPRRWGPILSIHSRGCSPPPRLRRDKQSHQHYRCRACFTLVKLSWAQTVLLPPLIFHFGAAVSRLKPHYCHRCTA